MVYEMVEPELSIEGTVLYLIFIGDSKAKDHEAT